MYIQKLKLALFLALSAMACFGLYYYEKKTMTPNELKYAEEIKTFRVEAEAKLRAPDGWLSVVGLTWLKDGANNIGSDKKNDIVLPLPAPAELGEILFSDKNGAQIKIKDSKNILIDDVPAELNKSYVLADDSTDKPNKVKVGPVSFAIIKRKNGYGVRVRNNDAASRRNFGGRKWYPPQSEFVVNAEWIPHTEPKKMVIPDILGNRNEETSPGFARFKIGNEVVELHPTQSDGELFFVFRDGTSGTETYGAARFLLSALPENGRVTLDFNKAVNPPCAFTEYATCPLPPKENITSVAIRAGELKP